jgi:hypothetical protein
MEFCSTRFNWFRRILLITMKRYNEFINESIRNKMLPVIFTDKKKHELIEKINKLEKSFKPITDIPLYENYEDYYDLIIEKLNSKKEDLYYITIKNEDYYIFSDVFGGLLDSNYTFVDSGQYDYYIYTNLKIVWCKHDRYYNDTIDMYIIDIPYFKKIIESL